MRACVCGCVCVCVLWWYVCVGQGKIVKLGPGMISGYDLRRVHFIKSARPTRALSNIDLIIQAADASHCVVMALSTHEVVFSKMLQRNEIVLHVARQTFESKLGYITYGDLIKHPIGLDKGGCPVNIFLISPRKHMLWVLIRSASARRF